MWNFEKSSNLAKNLGNIMKKNLVQFTFNPLISGIDFGYPNSTRFSGTGRTSSLIMCVYE